MILFLIELDQLVLQSFSRQQKRTERKQTHKAQLNQWTEPMNWTSELNQWTEPVNRTNEPNQWTEPVNRTVPNSAQWFWFWSSCV